MGLTSIFVTHDQDEALEMADRVVVMDHGKIEQVGTPEQVYMEPASPFVSTFVGETNRIALPAGEMHVRPHDIEIVAEGGHAVRVDSVFRRGGAWRVEGHMDGTDQLVELDVSASERPPALGETIRIAPRRTRSF
jgi:sulfate transport system ATP-binding protein